MAGRLPKLCPFWCKVVSRDSRRSFAVLPLVLGWSAPYMASGEGMDGDSETEEPYSGTKYVARPAVALRYDRASGEFVPAAGDTDAIVGGRDAS